MSFGKLNQDTGKKLKGFLGRQGFYLLMFACIGLIAVTAIAGSLTAKKEQKSLNDNKVSFTAEPVSNDDPVISEDDTDVNLPDTDDTVDKLVLMKPVAGDVIRPFSMSALVFSNTLNQWQTHSGIDIKATEGAKVVAALDGVVTAIKQDQLMGTTIVLRHSANTTTVYSSLKSVSVKVGDTVNAGQTIGAAGLTASSEVKDGAHVHFEYQINNSSVDPTTYFAGK